MTWLGRPIDSQEYWCPQLEPPLSLSTRSRTTGEAHGEHATISKGTRTRCFHNDARDGPTRSSHPFSKLVVQHVPTASQLGPCHARRRPPSAAPRRPSIPAALSGANQERVSVRPLLIPWSAPIHRVRVVVKPLQKRKQVSDVRGKQGGEGATYQGNYDMASTVRGINPDSGSPASG